MVMMHIKDILKDFSKYAEARKNYTLRTKLVFIFCSVAIAMVLFFSYRVVNNAMNKIIVVNEGGEFVHFKAMQTDKLFESLLKSHCYYTAYYLNSFDRLTIEENQARGLFLVNKSEANTIFGLGLNPSEYFSGTPALTSILFIVLTRSRWDIY